MKEEKKDKTWIYMLIGIIAVIGLPFVFKSSIGTDWMIFGKTPNEIGDAIGGMTSPIIGLLAAWLVYLAFREQKRANDELKEINQDIKSIMERDLLLSSYNDANKAFKEVNDSLEKLEKEMSVDIHLGKFANKFQYGAIGLYFHKEMNSSTSEEESSIISRMVTKSSTVVHKTFLKYINLFHFFLYDEKTDSKLVRAIISEHFFYIDRIMDVFVSRLLGGESIAPYNYMMYTIYEYSRLYVKIAERANITSYILNSTKDALPVFKTAADSYYALLD